MNPVRASKRISIVWSGGKPYEDTDTLVLTINGYSLDLRVTTCGPREGELDWASASRVEAVEGSTEGGVRSPAELISANPILRWTPLIDSHPPAPTPDQGLFRALPNGDVEERGDMLNPNTGMVEPYVEVWRRFENETGAGYCLLERVDGRAFVGRIGARAIGVGRFEGPEGGEEVWAWRDVLEGEDWRRVYTFEREGAAKEMCLPVTLPSAWKEGAEVRFAGQGWVIRSVGSL